MKNVESQIYEMIGQMQERQVVNEHSLMMKIFLTTEGMEVFSQRKGEMSA